MTFDENEDGDLDAAMRTFAERLLAYPSTDGEEAEAAAFVAEALDDLGFETATWEPDPDVLSQDSAFPPMETLDLDDRVSVGGVLEFGDPDAGPTLVLNGHFDVVPVEEAEWETDPWEPTWDGDDLYARGAADMKAGLTACVFAAKALHDAHGDDLDGRVVVEAVAGEEEGGLGAAQSAKASPWGFERDACIVAEPTELRPVTATEGSAMMELELEGRSAHAATRWRGESVLPHFEAIREAFVALEAEREERVTHPLYEGYPVKWPVNFGTVRAGSWASSVPASLTAQVRIGVAPGETVEEVEAEFRERLESVAADREWLREHPPRFERFSVQFTAAEVDEGARVVERLQAAMRARDLDATPTGATYGADSRHYLDAGIPTVIFGPGSIDVAHYPNEHVHWPEVETARAVLADAARRFLDGEP